MTLSYPIPDLATGTCHRYEEIIRGSRFIASLACTPDTPACKTFISRIQGTFPDATHNCWAFAAGPPGHTGQVGYSDDGEPHGTAGRPMLTILLHGGIGAVSAVVTRYFGGVKLGTGGLVRAYQGVVKKALESLPTKIYTRPAFLDIVIEYTHVTPFLRLLPTFQAVILSESFGVDVSYRVTLPEQYAETFQHTLIELTGGAILLSDCPPDVDSFLG